MIKHGLVVFVSIEIHYLAGISANGLSVALYVSFVTAQNAGFM